MHLIPSIPKFTAGKALWLVLALLVGLISNSSAGESNESVPVKLWVSSRAGDRISPKDGLYFNATTDSISPGIIIDDSIQLQRIEGFGAAFNEAGMQLLNSLPESLRDSLMKSLFDANFGSGFSLMKAPLGACDASSAGSWYSYDEVPGDTSLQHFSIERDLQPDGLIPYIRLAMRYGDFRIQSSMDFPPDWMLRGMAKGQKRLRKGYEKALAEYYVKYIEAYKSHGIEIACLSPFNEPDNEWYTNMSLGEIAALTRDYIHPRFKASGIKTQIQFCDLPSRTQAIEKLRPILDNPSYRSMISSVSVHGYDWNQFEDLAAFHGLYPDIPIWMTEVCYAIQSQVRCTPDGSPVRLPSYDFSDGQFWGNMIMNDLRNSVSAWIYWNMILDETGGRWLVSEEHSCPPYNSQQPVVIVNSRNHRVSYTGLYYYLSHFSRFIRPGATRLGTSGAPRNINFGAFRNLDGSMVLVLINNGKQTGTVIEWRKKRLRVSLPDHSISTLVW